MAAFTQRVEKGRGWRKDPGTQGGQLESIGSQAARVVPEVFPGVRLHFLSGRWGS